MGLFSKSETLDVTIPDMNCGHCEAKVTKALGTVPGVGKIKVDLPGKKVQISVKEGTGFDVINQALTAAGYPGEKL